MAKSKLEKALATYQSAIVALEQSQAKVDSILVLNLLKARDRIAKFLSDDISSITLLAVSDLDIRLRKLTGAIVSIEQLAAWRISFNPPPEAWWWFLDVSLPAVNRFSWFWSALAIIFLTISLSILLDTSSRFLSDGPDIWATLAVVGQSILAMLVAGGTLTTLGRKLFDRTLVVIKIPARWYQGVYLASSFILLSALLILRFSLPQIAVLYNNHGLASYYNGQYTSAEFNFRRAIKLSPDYVIPHYNLGLLYEDIYDYEQAKTEYRIAVAGNFNPAYNNLGRLYMRDKDYDEAVPLLLVGLDLAKDNEVLYDLHKNLGWARLMQTRYDEAEVELRAAVDLAAKKAPAHCLLALVLEEQQNRQEALLEWEDCLKYADPRRPDEDTWIEIARQRLKGVGP